MLKKPCCPYLKKLIILPLVYICLNITLVNAQNSSFTIGVVPQFEAKKLRTIWQPIIHYLEKETGYQFSIKGSPTIPDFENEFLRGEFDFAYMNPFHFILANRNEKYSPLVRDHGKSLHGVLVVKKDSDISEISQLDGEYIAFPAPNALGASLMIRQELQDTFKIKIYPRYVKTHDSVYLNVLLGEVQAGGGVQKTLNRQPPDYKEALRVIHQTKDVSPHPLAVHPRVPEKVITAVKTALLKLGESSEGKQLLSKIPIRKIGTATLQDYQPIKSLDLDRFYVK